MKILRPPQGIFFASLSVALFSLFCFTNIVTAQVATEVQADQPFAYWTMGESGPGAAVNIGTDASESASYPDNGQIEFGVEGLADPNATAVRFNGFDADSATAGRFDIANSVNSNSGTYLSKTVELWFSADNVDTDTEQVLYEQGGSTRGVTMYLRNGEVFVGAHNSNADAAGVASPWPAGALSASENELAFVSTSVESNTPYHLAFVMDGAAEFNDDGELDGTITGYLNGEAFGSVGNVGTLYGHTDPIRVGGSSGQAHFDLDFSGTTPFGNDGLNLDPPAATAQTPYFFTGVIDDVALYSTALSAERMKAHFDAVDYVQGDFDSNGVVDMADFTILSENFNTAGTYPRGDQTFNGQIDLDDFFAWRNSFNAPAQAASVPEPAAHLMGLALVIVLPLLRRRRSI